MLSKNKKIFIIYAGADVERDELCEISAQASACLERLGYEYEVICAYEKHYSLWAALERERSVALLLDPYYEHAGGTTDLRHVLQDKGIPFTGPGFLASKITKDKIECKQYLCDEKIGTIPHARVFGAEDVEKFVEEYRNNAYIVKPVDKGGGLDVEYFENGCVTIDVVQELLAKYGQCMIEVYISGQEIAVSVIRRPSDGKIVNFPCVGITLHETPVFNAEAKRDARAKTMSVNPEIWEGDKHKIVEFAKMAYERLQFNGLMRVDFICSEEGAYFLEANAYPSLGRNFGLAIPAARSVGYEQEDIIEWLIMTARASG